MKTSARHALKRALQQIADEHAGMLRPQDVVDEARDEDSPLHSYFEWDDAVAGAAYRLQQARSLIASVKVVYQPAKNSGLKVRVRAWESLASDRGSGEGCGYRDIASILTTETLRKQLLDQALQELQAFTDRYRTLVELSEVIKAADRVTRKITRKATSITRKPRRSRPNDRQEED